MAAVARGESPRGSGACCLGNGCLENVDSVLCEDILGGVFPGEGTDCNGVWCAYGACCFGSVCVPDQQESNCQNAGGQWHWPTMPCDGICGPCEPCDDGEPCTADSCDPAEGCVFEPITCDEGERCVVGVCADSSVILDQAAILNGWACSGNIYCDYRLSQTFTAGVDGALLRVDIYIERRGDPVPGLAFEIWPTTGGVPVSDSAASLASIVIPAGNVPTSPGFFRVDVEAPGLRVSSGEVLAIVLRPDGNCLGGDGYRWWGTQDQYAGGQRFNAPMDGGEWRTGGEGADYVFLTFVAVDDSDGDGVVDIYDACNDTPAGIPVDTEGRPIGDHDKDCDVDLGDYALFLRSFTGAWR